MFSQMLKYYATFRQFSHHQVLRQLYRISGSRVPTDRAYREYTPTSPGQRVFCTLIDSGEVFAD